MVEQPAVNRRVAGSSPASGANFHQTDAEALFPAENESAQGPLLNGDLGRVYHGPAVRSPGLMKYL